MLYPNTTRPLRVHKQQLLVAVFGVQHSLGLAALVLRAIVGVVADADDLALDFVAACVHDDARCVKDGEAATAAVQVDLVGHRQVSGADPCHGI